MFFQHCRQLLTTFSFKEQKLMSLEAFSTQSITSQLIFLSNIEIHKIMFLGLRKDLGLGTFKIVIKYLTLLLIFLS